jgi:hypothetical protein
MFNVERRARSDRKAESTLRNAELVMSDGEYPVDADARYSALFASRSGGADPSRRPIASVFTNRPEAQL